MRIIRQSKHVLQYVNLLTTAKFYTKKTCTKSQNVLNSSVKYNSVITTKIFCQSQKSKNEEAEYKNNLYRLDYLIPFCHHIMC